MYIATPTVPRQLRRLIFPIPTTTPLHIHCNRPAFLYRYFHSTAAGKVLTLPSNKKLGYHVSGPPNGTPVIYIHGHPDSGITITGPLETRIASELNIRWIGPDRPGVGLSTSYDEQEVLDYPEDIAALVEHLQLPEYYVIGTSGGTGFTLACAKDLPRKNLKGVGICAGVGPLECGFESTSEPNRKALEAWRDYPAEFKEYFQTEYVPLAQADDQAALAKRMRSDFESFFTGADREMILEESNFNAAMAVYRQVWAQGAWAHAKGMEFHWRPWGFALEDVGFPGIRLWYGEKDVNTTPEMGKYMADGLKGAIYREFASESHFTIWREPNLREMVRELIGR